MRSTVLLAGATIAIAASCSSGTASPSAVSGAARASLAAGSVAVSVTSITPTASGSSSSKATGAFSFASQQGTYSVDTGDLLGTVDALVSGAKLYVHVPPLVATTATKGKPWVSVSLDSAPAVPGVGNLPSLAGGAYPTRFLLVFRDAVTGEKKLSTDGNGTAHFTATVDLGKAAAKATGAEKAALQSEITLLGGATSRADVAIGSDGRIREIVDNVDLSNGKSPGSPKTTEVVTVELTKYGTAVAVTVPPPDQVVDASAIGGA